MASDRVVLKEEQVVGDEVVLKDINPKTSTESVDNSRTGETLDKTLEIMWNAINNKLSRIVNSINGRTGVVVMTADDVGLGNVDNVSLGDIKKWVINLLKKEFETKRIRLYDSLNEVAADVAKNDETMKDTAFYSVHGMDEDFKSYVGYIYLNPITQKLVHTEKVVNVVGKTDNSVIYNEELVYGNNDTKDYRGGKLGVNIWKYENALKIYNENGPKSESGLYIERKGIINKLYYFKGVYHDSDSEDGTSLLYYQNIPTSAPDVIIIIDGMVINGLKLKHTEFKIGDLIICDFKDYRNTPEDPPPGMSAVMMSRNPAIGCVVSAPSKVEPDIPYKISFHSIKPNAGWGLQYLTNHQDQVSDNLLSLKLATGNIDTSVGPVNMSGLQVLKSTDDMKLNDSNNTSDPKYADLPSESLRHTVTPQGVIKALQVNDSTVIGGLFVNPDMSLCIMPYKCYGSNGHGGSSLIKNWAVKAPTDGLDKSKLDNGTLTDASLLGINLEKKVIHAEDESDKISFTNTSGLRINKQGDINSVKSRSKFLGKTPDELATINPNDYYSGGLSVNVGKFLEIGPNQERGMDENYFDSGKINVRIGAGLEEASDIIYEDDDGNTTICKSNKLQLQVGTVETLTNVGPFSASWRRVTSGLILRETPDNDHPNMSEGLSVNVGSTFTGDYRGLSIYKAKRKKRGWYKEGHFYEDSKCLIPVDKNESWIYIDNTKDEDGKILNTEYMYIQRFNQFVTTDVIYTFYGFYNKSQKKFYKDNKYETAFDIDEVHQFDIYVDISTGNEMRYHDDIGDFVTIQSNGVVGVDYSSSQGLALSDVGLRVKIGGGLTFIDDNIVTYESNTTYTFGSFIVVHQARIIDDGGLINFNHVFIYDEISLERSKRNGWLDGENHFLRDTTNQQWYKNEPGIICHDNLTNIDYVWDPDSRSYREYNPDMKIAMYFKSSPCKNILSDIKKFGLRLYYNEGYYKDGKFYNDQACTNEIESDYLEDNSLYRDKTSGVVYKCSIDDNEMANFSPTYSRDTFEMFSYKANKGGSIHLKLAPNGGLSIYTGGNLSTIHTGDLMVNVGAGLAIKNNQLVFDPSSLTDAQVTSLKAKLGIS